MLLDAADRFGGSGTDPFFFDRIPATLRPMMNPVIVRDWPEFRIGLDGINHLVDRPSALISTDQLHAEVVLQIDQTRIMLGCKSDLSIDGDVLTPIGSISALLVIDCRPRPAPRGRRIQVVTAEYRERMPDAFDSPILLDFDMSNSTGTDIWQYWPLAADRLILRGFWLSVEDRPLSRPFGSSPPLMLHQQCFDMQQDDPIVGIPLHPLLPSSVEHAALMASVVASLPTWSAAQFRQAMLAAYQAEAPLFEARRQAINCILGAGTAVDRSALAASASIS